MKLKIKPDVGQAISQVAQEFRRRGHHPQMVKEAVLRAVRVARERRAGLGAAEDIFAPDVPERNVLQKVADISAVKSVRETVSPWLWVLSLVSFSMAMVNSRRIAVMFTNWKRRKAVKPA